MWPIGWVDVLLYSSLPAALEGGEWSAARPGRTLPPGKTRYLFYRSLGGPQGRSGRGGKSRPHQDSIPDRPARSQSLYRLSYPAHLLYYIILYYIILYYIIFDVLLCQYVTTWVCINGLWLIRRFRQNWNLESESSLRPSVLPPMPDRFWGRCWTEIS